MTADAADDQIEEVEAATPVKIEQRHRSRLEGIAFGLRIVDELAKRSLPPRQVDFILTAAEDRLAAEFCNDLLLPEQFAAFLNEKWTDTDPGTGVTLSWEPAAGPHDRRGEVRDPQHGDDQHAPSAISPMGLGQLLRE